jgi:hypothetical protein
MANPAQVIEFIPVPTDPWFESSLVGGVFFDNLSMYICEHDSSMIIEKDSNPSITGTPPGSN